MHTKQIVAKPTNPTNSINSIKSINKQLTNSEYWVIINTKKQNRKKNKQTKQYDNNRNTLSHPCINHLCITLLHQQKDG